MKVEPSFRDEANNVDAYTQKSLDGSVDILLAALRQAEARPGMEERLLQRLAETPAPTRHLWWRTLLAWTAFPALAACAIVVGLTHGRHTRPALSASGVARTQTAAGASAPKDIAGTERYPTIPSAGTPDSSEKTRAASLRRHAKAQAEVPYARDLASTISSSHQSSFPAPEMPLTEQEQLLLRVVHANDPVQVAMLDPRERAEALERDRAQVAQFFTPPPLPANLQHEINAALRKQYVNTPPPENLLP